MTNNDFDRYLGIKCNTKEEAYQFIEWYKSKELHIIPNTENSLKNLGILRKGILLYIILIIILHILTKIL